MRALKSSVVCPCLLAFRHGTAPSNIRPGPELLGRVAGSADLPFYESRTRQLGFIFARYACEQQVLPSSPLSEPYSHTMSKPSAEAYQKTLARIERIQSHLNTTPRAGRLKGKVCIITGVN